MASPGFLLDYAANYLARRLGIRSDISRETCKVETLFAERHYDHKPALYLDGELEKIKAAAFNRPIAQEVKSVKGKDLYSNTLARLDLRNAYVNPKYVLSGYHRKEFHHKAAFRFTDGFERRDDAALACSHVGCNYFGHWLRDDCATYLLAEQQATPPLTMATPQWREKPDYTKRFQQDWHQSAPTFCKNLSVYIDHGQNPHKAERFHQLRHRLRAQAPVDRKQAPNIVYLKRGPQSSSRALTNEAELIALLAAQGAYIHEAESGIAQLEHHALDARIMIGVEGSQLSHALYTMRDQGGLLTLQPPNRFFTSHLDWCREMDMEFAFMVGDPDGEGFRMDLDVLQKTLDLLDSAVA